IEPELDRPAGRKRVVPARSDDHVMIARVTGNRAVPDLRDAGSVVERQLPSRDRRGGRIGQRDLGLKAGTPGLCDDIIWRHADGEQMARLEAFECREAMGNLRRAADDLGARRATRSEPVDEAEHAIPSVAATSVTNQCPHYGVTAGPPDSALAGTT